MRGASSGLASFLASRPAVSWVAHLYDITLASGAGLAWTDFDQTLTVVGPYTPAPLSLKRMTMRHTTEVPEVEFSLFAAGAITVSGINVKTAVHNGLFDGARISLYRVWMSAPNPAGIVGAVGMFNGRLSKTQITASGIDFTGEGDNVLMNQQVPRNLYQTTCLHTFCDPGCTLLAANYTQSFSVGAGSITTTQIPWASAPSNPSLLVLGSLTFTSGACIGQTRTIRNADGTNAYLTYPLYGTPSPGDGFTALMGCARTLNACQHHTTNTGASVNNQQNFKAEPWTPQAELGA
jgi:uncharacterized phage protein (TIGR02218 family)